MHIDPLALCVEERYKLLIGAIVPRPIAWVSTISADGRLNLAPFSFFNGVSANPMSLLFCPANKADGSEKDTLANSKPVAEGGQGEFVVNVATESMARAMAACAEPLPFGSSEFDAAGLKPAPSTVVRPPRVEGSPLAFECRTDRVIRLNPGAPSGGNIVLGRVVHICAAEGLISDRYHVDPAQLAAFGRMGGPTYSLTRDRFDLPMGLAALAKADPIAH